MLAIGCPAIAGTISQVSCNKEDAAIAASTTTSESSDIAVASSATAADPDSLYIVHHCGNGQTRDSIAQSELPTPVIAYLESNYSGYLFNKAFSISDTTGAISGYVVVIYCNELPVGLEFDNNGEFVRVLAQREFDRKRHGGHRH